VAIFNGLGYVADDSAGLEVINYQAYDAKGIPPTITLSASLPTTASGATARVSAKTTDDVQVRNVEFYIDGAKVFSDGTFPFEYRFKLPTLTTAKTNLI